MNEGKSVSVDALVVLKRKFNEAAVFIGDLVDAIKKFGTRALPDGFDKKSYMEEPTWKRATQTVPILVRADLHRGEKGQLIKPVASLEPLSAGFYLHFKATTNTGIPFSADDYRVKWRITNTGEAAWRENCLRGGFYDPEKDNTRWEPLKYRGIHLAEAFVIRKRDGQLVGQSQPFRVMIE